MRLYLRLSPATSTTWLYNYTYDLHQAPTPSSRPSWNPRRAVTKGLLTAESTPFYSIDFNTAKTTQTLYSNSDSTSMHTFHVQFAQ